MEMVFLKKLLIKYFNPSSLLNQQDKEQDWIEFELLYCKSTWSEIGVETKEKEGTEFIIQLPLS